MKTPTSYILSLIIDWKKSHELIGTFNTCEDCALRNETKAGVSKLAAEQSKIKEVRLFLDISFPSAVVVVGI